MEGKLFVSRKVTNTTPFYSSRYTQTAVASFGVRRQTDCGQKPGGFTRLTPEVLNWVAVTVMDNHPGINDPGKMIIVQHHFLY